MPGYPASASAQSGHKPDQTSLTRVLVVDKARFSQLISRMLSSSFEVICVEEAPEAAKTLQSRNPDIVVAELDSVGGGLRLAELLDMNVSGHHTPFILTCIKPQADLVERARKVGVDALVVKPFPPSTLIERIGAVLKGKPGRQPEQAGPVGTLETLKERVRWIDGLPEFNPIHTKILEFGQIDGALNRDVAEQLKMDPFLVETALSLANACSDVFPRRVATLRQATSMGGFSEVANLVLTINVFETLGAYESDFDQAAFWKHSVGTGFIARTIGKKVKVEPNLCFMAGVLHDIGKVVLDRFFGRFYQETARTVRQKGIHSSQAELDTLGTTHTHVGGVLGLNWGFPSDLLEGITCHHDPSLARVKPKLASVIHLASAICNYLSYGNSGEVIRQNPDDPALNRSLLKLGVGPHILEQMMDAGEEQLKSADSFLEALLEGTSVK
jgi:HD-like signal output (HDOD) protein/CheY-like chemotaxis protein